MCGSILQAELKSAYRKATCDAICIQIIMHCRLVIYKLEEIAPLVDSKDWLDNTAVCDFLSGQQCRSKVFNSSWDEVTGTAYAIRVTITSISVRVDGCVN